MKMGVLSMLEIGTVFNNDGKDYVVSKVNEDGSFKLEPLEVYIRRTATIEIGGQLMTINDFTAMKCDRFLKDSWGKRAAKK